MCFWLFWGAIAGCLGYAVGSQIARKQTNNRSQQPPVQPRGAQNKTVRLICPQNARAGSRMRITADGRSYEVVVPPGIQPGMPFDILIIPTAEVTTTVVAFDDSEVTPSVPVEAEVTKATPIETAH